MSKKHKRKQHLQAQTSLHHTPQKPVEEQDEKALEHAKMVRAGYHIVITLLVLIAYANAFNASFVSDDVYGILNNPFIDKWEAVKTQTTRFFQPYLYYFISNTFGIVPFWFRLPNILAHIGSTNLLFVIVSALATPLIAFFVAALFAVHPILIEGVTWISGGGYGWYTFFFLASLWLYMKSKTNIKYYYVSILMFWLGLVVSIPAVVTCAVLFLYEYCFGDLKKRWKFLIPYFALSAMYAIVALTGIGTRTLSFKEDYYQDKLYYNPLLQIPVAISSYIELFFWPDKLTLYHSELQFSTQQFALKVIVMIAYFTSLVVSFFKNKFIFFALSIFIIGLLPTPTPLGIHWVVAERCGYFSTIGLILVFGYLLGKVPKKFETTSIVLFIIIIISMTVRTIIRNNDWQNEDNLWVATGKTSPSDPKTHNNLGDMYVRQKDYKRAAEELIIAIKINPNYVDAYHNLANVYQRTGQFDAALNLYQHALKLNPKLWLAYQNIGALHFQKEEYASAEANMKQAVKMNPNSAELHAFVGVINMRQGKRDEAFKAFSTALQLNPNNQLAQMGLAELGKK